MEIFQFAFLFISYLVGSIPNGLIVGKIARGIDIREYGSKNIGTTNAIRVLGKKLGILVFIGDTLKGGLPILIGRLFIKPDDFAFLIILYGICAIIGHVYPIFAKFKGGKAVATSFGVVLFYSPFIAIIGIACFFIITYTFRYVSLGSTGAALIAFVLILLEQFKVINFPLSEPNIVFTVFGGLVAFLITYRHRTNFVRLVKGTENKIGSKKQANEVVE